MGMGIIMGALSGAGDAVSRFSEQQQKVADEERLMQQRAELEEQKTKNVEQFKYDLQNAPQTRAGAAVSAAATTPVPVVAPPVTQLTGNDPENVGDKPWQDGKGLDLAADPTLLARIQAMPDSDPNKAAMIEQLTRQKAADQQAAQDTVAGQTRTPTSQEAMQSAYDALVAKGDMQAAAAIKAMIPEKTIKVGDGEAILDAKTNKVIFSNTGKADRQDKTIAAQMELERMKEDAANKRKERELDPLGLNTAGGAPGVAGSQSPVAQAIANGAHGDELLKVIPQNLGDQVKALAEGRMAFPAGFALKSPYWQQMMTLVSQYDPTFDAVNYASRAATRKDFTSGKAATSINAINTVMQHLNDYIEAGKDLDNSNFKLWNMVGNKALDVTGDPRITRFNTARNAVVDEVERAYRGSGGSQAGIEAWKENMSSSQSPAQILASGRELIKLLEGKMEALGDQYSKGMGTTKSGLELLSPKAQNVYNKVMGIEQPEQASGSLPSGWTVREH